jgi:tRNA uridine 5-carbamoylmethylation protein Kti12
MGCVTVGRFQSGSLHFPCSLRPYHHGFGANPNLTHLSTNSKTFINPIPLGDNMTKICYILKGLPGTGKSELAKNLRDSHTHARVFSTDSYFMVDGEYQFDPSKLGEYHAQNLAQATRFMGKGKKYSSDILCIIDNTNTQHWEYEKYEEVAKENGFMVQVITVEWNIDDIPLYAKRNSHGVPEEAIYRMAERWE